MSQCLPCEKLLFACLLNPIKSRLLRDLGTKRLGCERLSKFGAWLVWMTLIGSNTRPEVVIDAMIVDKNFIFWNSKMINKNRLLRKVTENKNHIRIKRTTQNRLGYLSLYFGSLKTHWTIQLRIKPLRHSSLTPWYTVFFNDNSLRAFLSCTQPVLGTSAVKVKFHFYIFQSINCYCLSELIGIECLELLIQ